MKDSSALAFWGITNHTRPGGNPENDGYIGGTVEGPMAFWHMSLADIIEGTYDGNMPNAEIPGLHIGKARYSNNSGFNLFTLGRGNNQWGYATNSVYEKTGIIVIAIGIIDNSDLSVVDNALLTPAQAYQIDKKLDDGFGYRGKVMSEHGVDVGSDDKCLDYGTPPGVFASAYVTATHGTIPYTLTNSNLACRMMFEIGV